MALFYNPIISAEPVFIVRPSSQRVGLNGIAKFDCVAQGNPPPSVFWAKEVKMSILLYILYLKFYKSCCCNSALEYPISNMIVKMSKWPNDTSLGVPTAQWLAASECRGVILSKYLLLKYTDWRLVNSKLSNLSLSLPPSLCSY